MDLLNEGGVEENDYQACYVLRGQLARYSEMSEVSSKKALGKRESKKLRVCENWPSLVDEPLIYGHWRFLAFNIVWGRVQKLIEDIMEDQNQDIYEEIQQWICNRKYGDAQLDLCQYGETASLVVEDGYLNGDMPRASPAIGKKLQTALMFLGGIDPSDHRRTFDGLAAHLRMQKCHVACLTSLDFSVKSGVGGLLRVVFRQFMKCSSETTDMEILHAWHREPSNQGLPVVFVVENAESCESKILAELVLLLSDWIGEIPIVLIMGMATAGEAIGRLLPARTLIKLRLWRFNLKAPRELLEVVMRAVMIDSFCALELNHEVVAFLYDFFQGHDLTVTAISRAFKVACIEHFWKEPLSFLCGKVLENMSKAEFEEECAALPQELLRHAASLPSVKRFSVAKSTHKPISTHIAESLWHLRTHKKMWAMVFLCVQSVGNYAGMGSAELLQEALSGNFIVSAADEVAVTLSCNDVNELSEAARNRTPLDNVIRKFRDMPTPTLKSVLEEWRKATIHENELNTEVCRILLDFDSVDKTKVAGSPESGKLIIASSQDFSIRVMNRSKLRMMGLHQNLEAQRTVVHASRKAAEKLLRRMIRQFLVPPELQPFSEVFCFKDVAALNKALTGETRKEVHLGLVNSREVLNCKCCPPEGHLSESLQDTTLAYILAQKHGDLIQVHDWYRSFEAVYDSQKSLQEPEKQNQTKGNGRTRKRVCPREQVLNKENICNEGRFTRAATELQIVGLLQLQKKGQCDAARRVCL